MAAELKSLSSASLADQAEEAIRSAILNGTLKPEQRFSIEEIAAQLGISRTPVREALKALQMDGMVRLLPHRGAMVETYAHAEIRTRYLVKGMLEGYAAELAMQADHETLAQKLLANCDLLEERCAGKVESEDDVQELMRINAEFHGLIREASGSATLMRLLGSLRQPTPFTINYWLTETARAQSIAIHRKIAQAFIDGDAKAARALMEQHTSDAYDRVHRHFAEANG